MKFYANLYSRSKERFFGKTFESKAYIIKMEDKSNSYRLQSDYPFSLYYHTKVPPDQEVLVLIEAHLFGTLSFRFSLSFTLASALLFPPVRQSASRHPSIRRFAFHAGGGAITAWAGRLIAAALQ